MKNEPQTATPLTNAEIEQYIQNYFLTLVSAAPVLYLQNSADSLLVFLNDPAYVSLKQQCATPQFLKLVCQAWQDRAEAYSNDSHKKNQTSNQTLGYFYSDILTAANYRFFTKWRAGSNSIGQSALYAKLKTDIGFLEHYAFLLMEQGVSAGDLQATHAYLNDQSVSFDDQLKLGFLTAIPSATDTNAVIYPFCTVTLQHFFCARFLISCFYTQREINNYDFPYQHQISKAANVDSLEQYLGLKAHDPAYLPIWACLEALLAPERMKKNNAYLFFQRFNPKPTIDGILDCAKANDQFHLHRPDEK